MKKHSTALAAIKSEDLVTTAVNLKQEITDLAVGIRLGDVQNYKMLSAKRKELARVLTRKAEEERKSK